MQLVSFALCRYSVYIGGLMKDSVSFSVLAMGLPQSCSMSSMWFYGAYPTYTNVVNILKPSRCMTLHGLDKLLTINYHNRLDFEYVYVYIYIRYSSTKHLKNASQSFWRYLIKKANISPKSRKSTIVNLRHIHRDDLIRWFACTNI